MPPASRLTDLQVCTIPSHGGGAVTRACTSVLVGFLPQARLGDEVKCQGSDIRIASGAMNVIIGGRPAARIGDKTLHAGSLITGFPTVLIGTSPALNALFAAAEAGLPFCDFSDCAGGGFSGPDAAA